MDTPVPNGVTGPVGSENQLTSVPINHQLSQNDADVQVIASGRVSMDVRIVFIFAFCPKIAQKCEFLCFCVKSLNFLGK